MRYNFMNDYNECADERILAAIAAENRAQDAPYGTDSHCENARALIRKAIGAESGVHFLVGGTQVNMTFLAATLRPHQGAVAADTAHIAEHETGAIEAAGHKVLTIPSADGKIYAADVETLCAAHYADASWEHRVQPGLIYISLPTEVGTLYTKSELKALHEVGRKYHMPLYADGARLGCALTSDACDVSLHDLSELTDAFTIGGTKNGALFGEALVINDPALDHDMRYHIKQRGGMLAKGRLLGIQFETLFTDELYVRLARHANEQARRLEQGLVRLGYGFFAQSPTNQLFPILPHRVKKTLDGVFGYTDWCKVDEENDAVRFCTSWATPPEMIDALLAFLPHA